jgi:hypothetical protein
MPPRRSVPPTETKEQKFERLTNLRTNLILDGLRKLGSLSNKNHHNYTEDEIHRIFDTIEEAVADAKSRFLGRTRREFRLQILNTLAEAEMLAFVRSRRIAPSA